MRIEVEAPEGWGPEQVERLLAYAQYAADTGLSMTLLSDEALGVLEAAGLLETDDYEWEPDFDLETWEPESEQ